jgi:hypothetical protein
MTGYNPLERCNRAASHRCALVHTTMIYNVYCDESGHLENDHKPFMVLGAVWCAVDKVRESAERLREIKARHGLSRSFEVKWSKVSPAKTQLYIDFVDYFFDDDDLHFRGLIADKRLLAHERFPGQTHDSWYYKMYFELLKWLLQPNSKLRIYVDIKDTRSAEKLRHLHDVLCSSIYDFNAEVVERLQVVRSHEVEHVQLADLLIGAVGYINRGERGSAAKRAVVERLRQRTGYSLTRSTLLKEEKFNLFKWQRRTFEQ